jgi:MFS family permease
MLNRLDRAYGAPAPVIAPQSPSRLFRGWYVVGALFVGGFALYGAGLYSFILFVTPLSEEFHWSRAATGGLVSAFWLSAPLSLIADPLIRRFGVKRLAAAGIVIEAACLILLFTASQLWEMYLLRALAGLGKVLYAINLPIILSRWFSRRFGLALAVMYCGWHLGGLALAPVTEYLIQTMGWRAASMTLGGALLVIALPPTLWLLRISSAADIGLGLDGDPLVAGARAAYAPLPNPPGAVETGYACALGDILRQRAFQLIVAATIVYYLTYSGVLAHQAAVVESSGASSNAASVVLGATAGFAAAGALLIGWITDRFSLGFATVVQHGLMAIGVFCLLAITRLPSLSLLAVHALAFGLALGGTDVFWITMVKRRTPAGLFQRSWSVWYFLELAVIVIAPAGAGRLYDLSGNYVTALTTELAILVVPLALCLQVSQRHKESTNSQFTSSQDAARSAANRANRRSLGLPVRPAILTHSNSASPNSMDKEQGRPQG